MAKTEAGQADRVAAGGEHLQPGLRGEREAPSHEAESVAQIP